MSPSEKAPARPMSDERLEELRRLVGIGRGVMDLATLDCIAEIYRLRDENKRLREALERINSAHDEHTELMTPNPEQSCHAHNRGASRALGWAQLIASEALGGEPT